MSKIYSVLDNKAHAFGTLMEYEHEVEATRMLNRAVNNPKVQLSMFPEDYDLYHIGYFDPSTGKITTFDQPKFVVSAVSFKERNNENGNA